MTYLIYSAPLLLCGVWYSQRRWKLTHASRVAQTEAEEAGLTEPVSLHPIVHEPTCIGCGSCIKTWPQNAVRAVLRPLGGEGPLGGPNRRHGEGPRRPRVPGAA